MVPSGRIIPVSAWRTARPGAHGVTISQLSASGPALLTPSQTMTLTCALLVVLLAHSPITQPGGAWSCALITLPCMVTSTPAFA